MFKRASRLFFLWVVILATLLSGIPAVSATPMDHPNTYTNTGNMRADLIGVALTQVGYYEGPNNDTKYGVWYGYNNLGWCGMFVSWCAEQAGIPKSIIPKTGTTNPADYKATVYSGTTYRPQPGDLFFRKSGSGYAHVGIVYYLDGDYFYTIEGNTYWQGPEGVYIRQRKISDFDFGVPNYTNSAAHSYQAAYETAHPHREYYKCSHCADQYYTGKTTTKADCRECITANCSHSFSAWTSSGTNQHARSCVKCGKKESANHSWNSGTVTKPSSCGGAGEKTQTCAECAATRTVTIPASTTHTYGPWKKTDSRQHTRYCTVCAREETKPHSTADEWSADEKAHWYSCSDCGGRISEETHSFGNECDTPCQICGFLREDGHSYGTDWKTDDSTHWHVCDVCENASAATAHIYDNTCDSICDTCGYDRKAEHAFPAHLLSDAKEHWKECAMCGIATQLQAHEPGAEATEEQAQTCTVCGWELSPILPHSHKYYTAPVNLIFHSSICGCGEELGNQAHTFDFSRMHCSICGFELVSSMPTLILIGAIPAMAIIAGLMLLIHQRKGRKYRY